MAKQFRVIESNLPDPVIHKFPVGTIVTETKTQMNQLITMLGAREFTDGEIVQGLTADLVEEVDE